MSRAGCLAWAMLTACGDSPPSCKSGVIRCRGVELTERPLRVAPAQGDCYLQRRILPELGTGQISTGRQDRVGLNETFVPADAGGLMGLSRPSSVRPGLFCPAGLTSLSDTMWLLNALPKTDTVRFVWPSTGSLPSHGCSTTSNEEARSSGLLSFLRSSLLAGAVTRRRRGNRPLSRRRYRPAPDRPADSLGSPPRRRRCGCGHT